MKSAFVRKYPQPLGHIQSEILATSGEKHKYHAIQQKEVQNPQY